MIKYSKSICRGTESPAPNLLKCYNNKEAQWISVQVAEQIIKLSLLTFLTGIHSYGSGTSWKRTETKSSKETKVLKNMDAL